MNYKSTNNNQYQQNMIAGMCQNDQRIEFFGIKKTKKVKFMQNGVTYDFSELKGKPAIAVAHSYEENEAAKSFFKNYKEDNKLVKYKRKLELYVYYMYGGIDANPDYENNELQTPENFRHEESCESLGFKSLRIDGNKLDSREVIMIDCFHKDYTNYHTASVLGIAESTLDYHIRKLLRKANVQTKTALMIKCALQNLI